MELINVETCMCALVYTQLHRQRSLEEEMLKQLLCHLYIKMQSIRYSDVNMGQQSKDVISATGWMIVQVSGLNLRGRTYFHCQ
jgi:hypothetical protein